MTTNWFITGASKGLGRAFTAAALDRGDRVAATARDTSTLDEFVTRHGNAVLPIRLDVRDPSAPAAAVRQAHEHFGRLDVVVNNAGYCHFGTVEELSDADLRDVLETNLFGAVRVTQAALPFLRAQGSGHIIQVTSIGGLASGPNLGAYHASKWALEGISEALAYEVGPLGVKVTLVEPGAFTTEWNGTSARRSVPLPEYDMVREASARMLEDQPSGDPQAAARALLDIVDAGRPPLRIIFGAQAPDIVYQTYRERLRTWRDWDATGRGAHG